MNGWIEQVNIEGGDVLVADRETVLVGGQLAHLFIPKL